jgi:hypothetical protein
MKNKKIECAVLMKDSLKIWERGTNGRSKYDEINKDIKDNLRQ